MPVEDSDDQFLRPAHGSVLRHGRGGGIRLRVAASAALAISAIFLGFGARGFLTSSTRLPIREVALTGAVRAEGVLTTSVQPTLLGRNLLALDLATVESTLRSASPWVRYVAIRRVFPDRVEIRVTEHDAVARDDRGSLLTRSGALLPEQPGLAEDSSLPRISGALATTESRARLVEFLALLERAATPFASRIASIRSAESNDLVIELHDRPYEIHLGDSQFEDRLNRYHNVETLLSSRYRELQTVDLRYSDRVVIAPVPSAESGG